MYNPYIAYQGPDGATRSLTNECTTKDGPPSRPYEFVTGYKSPDNVSGHCPDSNGITHGVDIFTGDLAWLSNHLAARGAAGDARVLYLIYADQIASPSTGWAFSGSGWGHWDHLHVSVWDQYWGGSCTLPSHIFDDTSPWGIATIIGQGSDITPIPEGQFMNISYDDQIEVRDNLRKLVGTVNTIEARTTRYLDTKVSAVAEKVAAYPLKKRGKDEKGKDFTTSTTVGGELAWQDANFIAVRGKIDKVTK